MKKKGIFVMVCAVSGFLLIGNTFAKFTSQAKALDNTFSTAESFISPTPSLTVTPTPTVTITITPSPTITPTITPTPTASCPPGSITISGNGDDSVNTVNSICNNTTDISQSNTTTTVIDINSTANSGGNSVSGNTNSNTTTQTGDASSSISVTTTTSSNTTSSQ